ncbi:MAG: repeat-associated core domain protein [Schlesneria sp.]|nr:repeat-associated core domain protein [Schlesneria sp.]
MTDYEHDEQSRLAQIHKPIYLAVLNGTTARVSSLAYDFRNRLVATDGEVDYFEKRYYDNLNRVVKVERYDTTAAGYLIELAETNYDDQGRAYQTIRYGVDPSTGTVGNGLTDHTWFDQSRNVIKSLPPGSHLWPNTKGQSMEITTFRYESKWLLAIGAHQIGITEVAAAFWSHAEAKWIDSLEEGTFFETEAGALVCRRGNLPRMTPPLKEISIQ